MRAFSQPYFPLTVQTYALLLIVWIMVIAFCLHYGRVLNMIGQSLAGLLFLLSLAILGLAGIMWCGRKLKERAAKLRVYAGLLLILILASVLAAITPLNIERTHIPLYGVLGFLLYRVVSGVAAPCFVWVWASFLGALLGGLDELLQHYHPSRVGDWNDVWLNGISSWLGVSFAEILYRCNVLYPPLRSSSL